ncbi:amino acid/amide ABC transporter substrate-binding protein, HAAT family [Haloechinothrix alba]|uniref:Amino acid/amide ABC transporter substrate-binding protein, HAAT family n=2 Tax=Haloechinothrix alba TaxID=664784 RepID=A0A238WAY0_9PSEU|nr:amino acid/amide ABC transporter substrate-binding protein, HAAT family [Haloechinothrix alba]
MNRRQLLKLMGFSGAVVAVSGCGGAFGGGSAGGEGSVKVGLLIPQSGVYSPLGEDMRRGWDLWLEQNGGTFGEYEVDTVVADEGEGPQTGVAAARRLLNEERCDVIVGIVNSAVALGIVDMVNEAQKLLLVANAGAGDITAGQVSPYIWRTSFTNAQVARAMGAHMATLDLSGGVYVVAPDYAAGEEAVDGFTAAFTDAGGTVAGQSMPPFGTTQDYQPVLSRIRNSGAEATYSFFAGSEAVTFVQQYNEFGLADEVPLYGSGFLTEGQVLSAQGQAAVDVRTALHYSTELDSEANSTFVEAYEGAYSAAPTVYAVQTYDAAAVLDQALRGADALDGDAISEELSGLDVLASPRGEWRFDGQSPHQEMYLRTVESVDGSLVNAVTDSLGEFGQSS